MKRRTVLTCLIALLGGVAGNSQPQMEYHVDHLSVEDGLPHVDVMDILEDEKGFLWIATLSGLCQYDGYRVKVFRLDDQEAPDRNRCNSMALDKSNRLWLGTQGGLVVFDIMSAREHKVRIREHYWEFIGEHDVQIRLLDSEGYLWITVDGQLLRLRTEGSQVLEVENMSGIIRFPGRPVISSMLEDRSSLYWIATDQGIFQIRKKDGHFVPGDHYHMDSERFAMSSNNVNSLVMDPEGNVVAGTIKAATVFFVDMEAEPEAYVREVKELGIETRLMNRQKDLERFNKVWQLRSAQVDSRGIFWFATDGGILRLEADSLYGEYRYSFFGKSESQFSSLNSETINMLFVNREDCLFAGTYGGGVNFFDTRQKRIFWLRKDFEKPDESLKENVIRSIEEDASGNLLIGTQNGGLDFYDLKTGQVTHVDLGVRPEDGASRNTVRALKLEKDRYLWIGTINELLCYDLRQNRIRELPVEVREATSLEHGYITDIQVDGFGNLWISAWYGGIFRCIRNGQDPLSFTRVDRISTSGDINSICITEDKREVMAGSRQCLIHFRLQPDGEVESYRVYSTFQEDGQGPGADFIWDIVPLEKDLYYLGSIGKGLMKLDMRKKDGRTPASFYLEQVPLPERYQLRDVEAILKDENNNLWLAGKSLFFFDTGREELVGYDFDKATFGNIFKVGAAHRGASGRLYFGGIRGVSMFYPGEVDPNRRKPQIQLTDLFVHNIPIMPGLEDRGGPILERSLAFTDAVSLRHDQNDFTLGFSAMQFQNPGKSGYRYMLEGYDRDWKYMSGETPMVSYSNLKYRKYRFLVEASNNDGLWSESPSTLEITVHPPWWRSRLAIVIYFLCIVMVVFGIYFNQRRFYEMKHALALSDMEKQKREELHQMKLRFFTDISHEIRTPISLILAPMEELRSGDKGNVRRNRIYGVIEKNARKLLRLTNELIEFRKLESNAFHLKTAFLELNGLLRAVHEQFLPLAANRDIELSFEGSDDYIKSWFDAYVIERIVTNLLSNALKYTGKGGSVGIRLVKGRVDRLAGDDWPHVTIGEMDEDLPRASVLVRDDGEGIQEGDLFHIFERFYHREDRQKEYGGSGIGLAIVQNLVHLHRARMQVWSRKEEGTVFLLELPLSEELSAFADNPEEGAEGRSDRGVVDLVSEEGFAMMPVEYVEKYRNTRLMIVEDEDDLRSYLEARLSPGFIVRSFSRAGDALAVMEEFAPDLVISDIMMPGMNGFDFCRSIKEGKDTCHLPVILLSARTAGNDLVEGAESLADLYITKPFEMKCLLASIHGLLENRRKILEMQKENIRRPHGNVTRNEKDKELIDQIIRIISVNLTNPSFSVDFLAEEIGIGRTKLYKQIREITGFTLGELIRDVKMKRAVQLMLTTDSKIAEVALEVGISSNFFYSMFKDYYGMTPSEYLKRNS